MRRRLLGALSAAIVGGLLAVVPAAEAAPVGTLTVSATVSGDPASCVTDLDLQRTRLERPAVGQTPEVHIEAPDTRLLVPEQQVRITETDGGPVRYAGGGRLLASYDGETQPVADGQVTVFDQWPRVGGQPG